jgi:alcohol dehydrogenase
MIAVDTMRATVFHAAQEFHVEEVDRPRPGPGQALIRITLTTICGTDVHIVKGEYPVRPGLVLGHEPVGVIEELGAGVTGYEPGERVLVGAITPCGQCHACLAGHLSQCGHGTGYEALGGWRFGNTIDGAQAEYLLVPSAQANLARIPDDVTDEQVVLLADIASTGFSGAESGGVRIGDTVVVFAQGPIGLCATAGAKLMGAAQVIGVDSDPVRLAMSRRMGADLRERPALAATGRDAVQPGCLLGQAGDAVLRLRGRVGRPPDRDDPVPRWQGAHGPADRHGPVGPLRPDPAAHAPLRAA